MRKNPNSKAIFIGSYIDPYTGRIKTPGKPKMADFNPSSR